MVEKYPHFRDSDSKQRRLSDCPILTWVLSVLEMDFHCKEFQSHNLTKLLCSPTYILYRVAHHWYLTTLNCHADLGNLKWPEAYYKDLSSSQTIHLIITSSVIFKLRELLTQSTFPDTFQQRSILPKNGRLGAAEGNWDYQTNQKKSQKQSIQLLAYQKEKKKKKKV